MRATFAENNWVSDAQTSLCVGEIVCLRLRSSELVESQVIHVHEGKEERVDVQLQTPEANGKFLTFKGVSRRKLTRPRLRFCDDSRWVEAAAKATGFPPSEVYFSFVFFFVYLSSHYKCMLTYLKNNMQIPERLKRMEQAL